jgi:hypothetical protein
MCCVVVHIIQNSYLNNAAHIFDFQRAVQEDAHVRCLGIFLFIFLNKIYSLKNLLYWQKKKFKTSIKN